MKMLKYAMAFAISLSVFASGIVLTGCTDEAIAPLRDGGGGEDDDDPVPPPPAFPPK